MPSHMCVCVRVARVCGCVPLAPPPCGGMGLETHARRWRLGHRFLYVCNTYKMPLGHRFRMAYP